MTVNHLDKINKRFLQYDKVSLGFLGAQNINSFQLYFHRNIIFDRDY